MTARKRRILIVLGAVAGTLVIAAGILTVFWWPNLPDRVEFRDGRIVMYYILPHRN